MDNDVKQTEPKPESISLDNEPKVESQNQQTGRQLRGISWALVVSSILTSTFLFGLDNTIVADIQPAVVRQFQSVDRLPWLSVAFLIGAASTTLFWGQMYAQCNAKWLYIACLTLFEIGSAICGAAPNIECLIIGRAIAGLAGTGTYTGVSTLLSLMTDVNERATYFAMSGLVWGLGTVLGPIVGGAFTSGSAGWRWAFYINLCLAAVFAPVYIFMMPSIRPQPDISIRKCLAEVDFIGAVLLVGTFVSGLMAISFGGVVFPWGSGQTIALFVVAFVLAIAFFCQQIWCIGTSQKTRALPLDFLKNKELLLTFILECCASTLTYLPIYFIPLYFQFVREDTALVAGVRVLPLVVFLVVAIVIAGTAMTMTGGRYMPWFLAGGVLSLIGSALLYTINLTTSNAQIYGYSILIGAGAGCFLQLPFSVVQALVPPESIPKAVGFVTFAQLGAPSIMLSVANAVFLNEASRDIASVVPELPRDAIISILSGVGSTTFSQLDYERQQRVLMFIVQGLNKGFAITITSGGLALVLSLFLKRSKIF